MTLNSGVSWCFIIPVVFPKMARQREPIHDPLILGKSIICGQRPTLFSFHFSFIP
jgi:hypothetical protein